MKRVLNLNENEAIVSAIRKAVRSSIIYNLDSTVQEFKKAMKDMFAKREVGRIIFAKDWLSLIDPTLPPTNRLKETKENLATDAFEFEALIRKEVEAWMKKGFTFYEARIAYEKG